MKPFSLLAAILIYFGLGTQTALCQEEFIAPHSQFITRFSFTQISGGIIILQARVDNFEDTLNFVFDTGSGGISLDSTTVQYLGIKKQMSDKTIRGIAGIKTVEFAYDHTLKLPGLNVEHLDFHINDYELLTSVYGIKIDGIIGFSFLRRYIVKIDYDKQIMEVYTPGSFKYQRGGYMLHPDFTTLPLQGASVKDERTVHAQFIFDTGAGLTFLLSRDFVEDSLFLKKKRRFYPTQAEGLGGKRLMDITVINEVKIGPFRFRKVPVHVFEDEYNVTSYPMLGGLIGNDLMRRFNIVLNYPARTIYIRPNNHYNESFDYSYTGLGIYLVDGEIRVVDIIKGSPGDKAGFQPGDIIFSVESNFSKNIQTYKSLFQNALGKIRVVIFRNNQPLMLTLDVKDVRR
ncbi:MAG: signal protein PDZ [Chitinophagaceae bacterium]|nr:signal protein PDZ [Chitinophagaceae bacterium]